MGSIPQIDTLNQRCCSLKNHMTCNDMILMKLGFCAWDMKMCPIIETKKPTPPPTVKECCCKTKDNINQNWVNPECCPKTSLSENECNALQWNTGRCWYDRE